MILFFRKGVINCLQANSENSHDDKISKFLLSSALHFLKLAKPLATCYHTLPGEVRLIPGVPGRAERTV